jgi:hypothetical protein
LEQGKTRAIYSCDTRSYYTFDYLLAPIEELWTNHSVLLNPGIRREDLLYKDFASSSKCLLMLDYDDFNSQHTLEAMKIVIEEATAGAPEEVVQWATKSLSNMFVHWTDDNGELREAKMVGTLPSGHRATTFINTVLNAAYIWYACKGPPPMRMLHTGDDVIGDGTPDQCEDVLRAMLNTNFRLNPSKQAIGQWGEFLRAGFDREGGRGYSSRAIASLVSGNWVTEAGQSRLAVLNTLCGSSWNVAVRLGWQEFGELMVSTLSRRVPEVANKAREILTFRISVNSNPVWSKLINSGPMLRITENLGSKTRKRRGKSFATDDYISKHVDLKTLELFGVDRKTLRKVMLAASYKPVEGLSGGLVVTTTTYNRPIQLSQTVTIRESNGKVNKELLSRTKSLSKEERACFRALLSNNGGKIVEPWPIHCPGLLPWSVLTHMASNLGVPGAIVPRFPLRK